MILNPEAVGDPNQTPVVYLGPAAAEVLGIRQRNPLAVCEFCERPVVDPTALCERDECQALTSERDSVMAGLVAAELTYDEIAVEKRRDDL